MLYRLGISKVDFDKLQDLRNPDFPMDQFRRDLASIGTSLYRFAVREAKLPDQKQIYATVVMRAGQGLWFGALNAGLVSETGFIDATRDEDTFEVVIGMDKTRKVLSGYTVLVFDTMLATGNTLSAVISVLRQAKPERIVVLSLLAAPEGVAKLQRDHPDVDIVLAKIDEKLDDKCFIVPGLGDAGNRLFGRYG